MSAPQTSIEEFTWPSDLDPGDLTRTTDVYNAVWDEWVPGEPPLSPAAYVDMERFTAHPDRVARRLIRDGSGELVGHGKLHWREEPGSCGLHLFVDPKRRGEGFGGALGRAFAETARAEGRTGVSMEVVQGTAADEICRAHGLRVDMEVEQHRTDPRSIPPELLEQWRLAGEAAAGYSLVGFDVPCPSDDLGRDFVAARMIMNDAPRGEDEPEATYTLEELLATEAASQAAHQDWWNLGIRHEASGELVGLSEMYLPRSRPWLVFQGDTGVAAAHRGHGLGAWMKAVNHERLNAERQRWRSSRRGTPPPTSPCSASTERSGSSRCSATKAGSCR